MPTRAELIDYYRALPDDQLLRLALYEAGELTPEALEVLKEEIRMRRLGEHLEAGIEAQTRLVRPEEQEELVARFRRLPCPICGVAGRSAERRRGSVSPDTCFDPTFARAFGYSPPPRNPTCIIALRGTFGMPHQAKSSPEIC